MSATVKASTLDSRYLKLGANAPAQTVATTSEDQFLRGANAGCSIRHLIRGGIRHCVNLPRDLLHRRVGRQKLRGLMVHSYCGKPSDSCLYGIKLSDCNGQLVQLGSNSYVMVSGIRSALAARTVTSDGEGRSIPLQPLGHEEMALTPALAHVTFGIDTASSDWKAS